MGIFKAAGLSLFAFASVAAMAQQLPFDPNMSDQLSAEQQQRAREILGQPGGGGANPQGRFNDQILPQPQVVRPAADLPGARPAADSCAGEGGERGGDALATPACRAQRGEAQDAAPERGEDQAPRPFGYDLFQGSPSTFAPVTEIPLPGDYVLGPGDNLRVQLYGSENANYSLAVSRDGRISFPKLGPIAVAGQHFEDVKELLEGRVSREMIGVQASVTLGELRSMRVFLLGDVNHPGSYMVSSLSTITNVLFVGGGVGLGGSLRNIQLKRSGRVVQTLDLYELLLRGDSSGDLRLEPGDVVFVPTVGARVTVDGEVKRPAVYELRGEQSVRQVLGLAGGVLASTNTGAAQIERYDRNRRRTLQQIDLERQADLAARVQDGDVLRIRKVTTLLDNKVRVLGAVKYPGDFEWSQGLQLDQLLALAQVERSDLRREVYLPLGLIERTDPHSGVRNWTGFNLQATLAGSAPPLPLQQDDLVVVLTLDDISYLYSTEVEEVASGNFSHVDACPALGALQALMNSERSIRFARAFASEDVRLKGEKNRAPQPPEAQEDAGAAPAATTTTAAAAAAQAEGGTLSSPGKGRGRALEPLQAGPQARACPAIFRKLPQALPYLLEESVAVYGEVRRPGLYPVAAGSSVGLLVDTAGGLTRESDPRNVEYVSYEAALRRGDSHYQTLDLAQAPAREQPIHPGDVFNFKPVYIGQEIGKVKVVGAFRFPGSYGILSGEHLSQLMKRAGGLTPDAFPYGVIFTRESARRAEQESYQRAASDLQEAMVTAVTSGALKDASNTGPFLSSIVQKLKTAEPIGRVVTEGDPTVLEARPELDPVLEPGDAIFMPKRPITVTIIGQVLNPGSQAFSPGATLRQYVDRAGGYGQAADKSRVFVILPNGAARRLHGSFWNYEPEDIPPGSCIVVPRDAVPFNTFVFSEQTFSVLANLAVTAAALATISRN